MGVRHLDNILFSRLFFCFVDYILTLIGIIIRSEQPRATRADLFGAGCVERRAGAGSGRRGIAGVGFTRIRFLQAHIVAVCNLNRGGGGVVKCQLRAREML